MKMHVINTILTAALMTSGAAALPVPRQEPDKGPMHDHIPEQAQAEAENPEMMAQCRQMMAGREAMMACFEQMDSELGRLVVQMNAAEGDEKVAQMASIFNALAARLGPMLQEMMRTQSDMMSHMMEHMRSGGMVCPMMHTPSTGSVTPDAATPGGRPAQPEGHEHE